MQKHDCILQLYSSANMLHTPFLEKTSGDLLLYIVLNIGVINIKVFSKQVKNLKYISIL